MPRKNTTGMKTGAYVSRAAYTKVQMERDGLLRDIHTLVMHPCSPRANGTEKKWRERFIKDNAMTEMLALVVGAIKKNKKIK